MPRSSVAAELEASGEAPIRGAENYGSRSARSPMSLLAEDILLSAMTELEQQWIRALGAATDALEAAACAHALPPGEVEARRRRLLVEHAWRATVDWPGVGESTGATITVLEMPSRIARPRLVKPAA
jgi:hypothetical protein